MLSFETYLFDDNDMREDKRVSVKQIFIYMVSLETSGATLKVSDIDFSLLSLENKCSISVPFKRRNKVIKSEMCDSVYIMLYS